MTLTESNEVRFTSRPMSRPLSKHFGSASVLVFIALITATPLAIVIGAYLFPSENANTLEIAAVVTAVVEIPLCIYAATQIFYLQATRSRLAQQKIALIAANKRAEDAAVARSRFLAFMSHEIRTPLNGMLGTAQLLKAQSLESDQHRLVLVMENSGQMLMSLLNDVLDLSKIEAGELEIVPVECALRTHIEHSVSLYEAAALNKGLRLELSVGEDVPDRAVADTTRLGQCLGNLLSNAIKFTQKGGVFVDVGLRREDDGDMLVIEVQDTGTGISEDVQARIFEPFVQADSSVQSSHGGTGLGLAICRELALRQGGDLSVTSRAGEGASFRLQIALEAIRAGSATPVVDELPPGTPLLAGKRILIVDDTDTNRLILRMFLQQHGAETVEAADGIAALEIAGQKQIDLVLLDMEMPVLDGRQTAKRLRVAHGHDLPIIAVTANAMQADQEVWRHLGIQGYVPKPVDQKVFEAEVFGVLKLFEDRVTDAA